VTTSGCSFHADGALEQSAIALIRTFSLKRFPEKSIGFSIKEIRQDRDLEKNDDPRKSRFALIPCFDAPWGSPSIPADRKALWLALQTRTPSDRKDQKGVGVIFLWVSAAQRPSGISVPIHLSRT
jgi:hypothetical protein